MSELHRNWAQSGKAAAIVATLLVVAGVSLMWGWNTVAVDLFQAPAAKFKHVLAFEFAMIGLAVLAAACTRLVTKHSHPANQTS